MTVTAANEHDIAQTVRLQENRVSWSEEKREPTVRYVCLCQFVCTCHGRAKTLRNLIQGQSALFQEKEQKSREIMAIFCLNYLNQVQIAANTSSRNKTKAIIQRFPKSRWVLQQESL